MTEHETITTEQARAIDRDAVTRLGMPSILLMENAAHGVVRAARTLGNRFTVLCGPGNNGGDGLAVARLLGPERCAILLLSDPDPSRAADAALQARILANAGWTFGRDLADLPGDAPDRVWIDALFGTGLTRAVDGRAAEWIEACNRVPGPVLAVDVPSGLDADRGVPAGGGPAVRAALTVTFAAAKCGLVTAGAAPFVGRLEVAPLGIPASPSPGGGRASL